LVLKIFAPVWGFPGGASENEAIAAAAARTQRSEPPKEVNYNFWNALFFAGSRRILVGLVVAL
jgi:hypothetical protein